MLSFRIMLVSGRADPLPTRPGGELENVRAVNVPLLERASGGFSGCKFMVKGPRLNFNAQWH